MSCKYAKWNILNEQSQSKGDCKMNPDHFAQCFWLFSICSLLISSSHRRHAEWSEKRRIHYMHVGTLNSSRAWRFVPCFHQIGFLGDLGMGDVKTFVGDMKFNWAKDHPLSLCEKVASELEQLAKQQSLINKVPLQKTVDVDAVVVVFAVAPGVV